MTGDIILLVYSIIIPVSSVKHRKFPLRTNAIWVCNHTYSRVPTRGNNFENINNSEWLEQTDRFCASK